MTFDNGLVEIGRSNLVFHLGNTGQHAEQSAHAPDFFNLRQLVTQIIQIEFAFAHFFGKRFGFFSIDILRGLFNEGNNIPHAQNAIGNPRGMEIIQRIHFFAHADQLDRLAGHRAHRQGRATAPVAIHPRQNNTGNADPLFKGARSIDRILTGQSIRHQQDFMRFCERFDFGHFGHQGFIDRCAPCSIEQHHIKATQTRGIQGAAGDLHRALACDNRQCLNRELLAKGRQLFHRRRTAGIERGHQNLAPVAFG